MKFSKKYLPYLLIIFLLICLFIVVYIQINDKKQNEFLEIVFIDVGQGDAIYIEAPNGRQILIDGGRDQVILPKLAQIMPLGDKSIDLVIATNPDQDHIGGLIDVFQEYKIGQVIEPGTEKDSYTFKEFNQVIEEKEILKNKAWRGQKIILDEVKNIYFEILFPDRDVSEWEANDGSIVGKLVYGEQSFLLMGDATKYTENLIRWNEEKEYLDIRVLKLGHHGSDTSTTEYWLYLTSPEIAIISAGANNKYGHPDQEVINNLEKLNILYFETSKEGNIVFKTDGITLTRIK
jgi:competence protein ComEC